MNDGAPTSERPPERRPAWLSPRAVAPALFAATLALIALFHGRRAFGGTLLWHVLAQIACAALFAFGCLAAGTRIFSFLFGRSQLPASGAPETAADPLADLEDGDAETGFVLGLVFAAGLVLVAGLFRQLRASLFVLVLTALFVVGLPVLPAYGARIVRFVRKPRTFHLAELALLAGGVVALVAIYLPILSPQNLSYDARWYHLGLAEHDVAQGFIGPHPEGVIQATISSLPTLLYTWCWLLPFAPLYDKIGLCAHLELVCFLFTLWCVPVLVRRLVAVASSADAPPVDGRTPHDLTWLSLLLFPSIFVYDTSLVGGGDHLAAAFAIPLWLATTRAIERDDARSFALVALLAGALLVTKLSAGAALVGPVLVLAACAARCAWSARDFVGAARRLGVAVAVGALATAPLWLRNVLFYGDPLYPMLHRIFPGRPFLADGAAIVEVFRFESFVATGPFSEELGRALRALVDHSFGPYNWRDIHGSWPIFGSAFTVSLLVLPFVRATRAIWRLVLAVHVAIPIWYFLSHQERYLLVLVPWMAASVAATFVLVWRRGELWSRAGVVGLCAVQIGWALDMPFWPTHRMNGRSGLATSVALLGAAYGGEDVTKRSLFPPYTDIARVVPRHAQVLVHLDSMRLGIGAATITDRRPHQLAIDYGQLGSLDAVATHLRSLGATHLVWSEEQLPGQGSLASELLFFDLARRAEDIQVFGKHHFATMPVGPFPRSPGRVALVSCDARAAFPPGVYALADLAQPVGGSLPDAPAQPSPAPTSPPKPLPARLEGNVDYVLREPRCGTPPSNAFQLLANVREFELWAARLHTNPTRAD